MSELLTERTWTADDIGKLFDAECQTPPWTYLGWYGSLRSAWIEAKWPQLIEVVNESRDNDGLPALGSDDFDYYDAEIEDRATVLADITPLMRKVGSGRPVALAFRLRCQYRQIMPTVFFEQATEQEVREAIRGLVEGNRA